MNIWRIVILGVFTAVCCCTVQNGDVFEEDIPESVADEVSGRYFGTGGSFVFDSLPNPYILDAIIVNDTTVSLIGLHVDSIIVQLVEHSSDISGDSKDLEYFNYDRIYKCIDLSFPGFVVFEYSGCRRD